MEVNPVMRLVINNPFLAIVTKIVLPALLIAYLFLSYNKIPNKDCKYYYIGVSLLALLYTLIDVLHIYYLTLFL